MTQSSNKSQTSTEKVTNIDSTINGLVVTTESEPFELSGYGFVFVNDLHDNVSEDVQDNAVAYTGKDNLAVHYTAGESTDDVPQSVIDAVEDKGYEIVQGQDAGWNRWNGRPEFSQTYFEA